MALQLSLLVSPRHVIPISGKDSLATALFQTKHQPDLAYEFIFNDTGAELPEVYEWLNQVEVKTGWTIKRIGENLETKIHSWNGFLPSPIARFCTSDCKIDPTDRYLSNDPTYVYYGLRADEDRVGYIPSRKNNIQPVYPLKKHGLRLPHVWAILEAQNLLPPNFFWKRLYDAVCDQLSPENWLSLEKWQIRQLFSGRSRANCYFCFFQRLAEFLWLYEVHPDYFERARAFETSGYTWIKDYPLSLYDDSNFRAKQFEKHVNKLCKALSGQGKYQLKARFLKPRAGLFVVSD
jgi:3'-phosphoadenosine 5'-phosphosulfate sulfotransferase (PAPS reductase)/FAD synthetase